MDQDAGNWDQAFENYRAGLGVAVRRRSGREVVRIGYNLANLLIAVGALDEAQRIVRETRVEAFQLGMRVEAAFLHLLVAHLLERAAREGGRAKAAVVTPAAFNVLMAYGWPGNVRELDNALRRATALADGDIDIGNLSEATGSAFVGAGVVTGTDGAVQPTSVVRITSQRTDALTQVASSETGAFIAEFVGAALGDLLTIVVADSGGESDATTYSLQYDD